MQDTGRSQDSMLASSSHFYRFIVRCGHDANNKGAVLPSGRHAIDSAEIVECCRKPFVHEGAIGKMAGAVNLRAMNENKKSVAMLIRRN